MTEVEPRVGARSEAMLPAAAPFRPRPLARRRLLPLLGVLTVLGLMALLFLLYGPPPGAAVSQLSLRGGTLPAPALSAGNAARGGETWTVKGCGACHGPEAEGGRFPDAPSLVNAPWSCAELHAAVRSPRDPAKGMPPFPPEQVPDAAISDICAWLASLR